MRASSGGLPLRGRFETLRESNHFPQIRARDLARSSMVVRVIGHDLNPRLAPAASMILIVMPIDCLKH